MFDGSERKQITKPVRLIELFAGIGAQAKALEKMGVDFEHYRVVEKDETAVKSYNAIHGTAFAPMDIMQTTAHDLAIVDTQKYEYILTYSFPCQDLSKAGTLLGMEKGTRSGLLWEVGRILQESAELPQVLLMENVPEVVGDRNVKNFARWLDILESLGYRNYFQTCNARHYNVPQNRERMFMVSVLGDYYYHFPRPVKLRRTVREYYDDTRKKISSNNDSINLILEKTENVAFIKQCTSRGYAELKNGGCCALDYPKSKVRRGRVIQGGNISQAITCSNRELYKFIDGEFYRISPRESFRLMGFDDKDFDNCSRAGISDNQLYNQAGNSIVVDVLIAIFKNMF